MENQWRLRSRRNDDRPSQTSPAFLAVDKTTGNSPAVTQFGTRLRSKPTMRNKKSIAGPLAVAFVFLLTVALPASAQNATNVRPNLVPQGQKVKIQGVVSIRSGDTFKVRATDGAETTVMLTGNTDVTSHARGLRGKKEYPVTYIMRGLRVQAQGRGDAQGNLEAEWVRFDEQDLRAAQALEQTNELAEENAAR